MTNDYVEHFSGLVKIIDFKKFSQPSILSPKDPVGHIFVAIKEGLVENYVDCLIYQNQIDDEGNPILAEINLTPYISYDLHDNVAACLLELSSRGTLHKELQVKTHYLEDGMRAISVGKWSRDAPPIINPNVKQIAKGGYSVPVPDTFLDFLLEKMEGVEKDEGSFSYNWYLLRISLFYFLSPKLTANDIFNIGFFSAQMSSKFSMEADALKTKKANIYRKIGMLKHAMLATTKREAKENAIIKLRDKVIETEGLGAVRIDSIAASYIYALAITEQPKELLIRKNYELLSQNTIRNHLVRMRQQGKIA